VIAPHLADEPGRAACEGMESRLVHRVLCRRVDSHGELLRLPCRQDHSQAQDGMVEVLAVQRSGEGLTTQRLGRKYKQLQCRQSSHSHSFRQLGASVPGSSYLSLLFERLPRRF
jgi:hypothetical protein